MAVSNQIKGDWVSRGLNKSKPKPQINETIVYGPWLQRWSAKAEVYIEIMKIDVVKK